MLLDINCSSYLNNVFYIVKNILNIIMIIVPVLLIIFTAISFVKLVKNPEEKNGIKKIMNQFLAAGIVFFIPLLVNLVMGMLGNKTSLSSCWNDAKKGAEAKYYSNNNSYDKHSILLKPEDYESGLSSLDFSCTSKVVKGQLSCDTLKVVEKHMHELNANNFYDVINNQYNGDFASYARSVGGIFGEYYGKKIEGRTVADFQMACEYVLGWMYMYGWTYWGSNSSLHVFWKNGFYHNYDRSKVHYYSDPPYQGNQNFDVLISAKHGINNMASACGELEIFAYNKMGISRAKQLPKVSRLKDLKVGDGVYFFNHKVDKTSESNWGVGRHNVIVGEVYDDHLVFYDVGGTFPDSGNYKRPIYFPKDESGNSDMDAIRKEYPYYGGNVDWGMRRFYNFES